MIRSPFQRRLRRRAALAALIATALGAPSAVAIAQQPSSSLKPQEEAYDGFIEYEVERGDSCIRIARKVYGDGDLCYDLMAGSNEFDEKFRVYPGQKLKLPSKKQLAASRAERLDEEAAAAAPSSPSSSGSPDATLRRYRGEVTARSPEVGAWEAAERNKSLWRKWKVNSAGASSAEVYFTKERATLRMRENTLVVIYGEGATSSSSATPRAVLEQGALATRLDELSGGASSSGAIVETPSAVVTTAGGDALVSLLEGDTTLVANHTSPSTKVRGRTKRPKVVELPVNTGSRVEKGKDPTPPRPLPSPPSWLQGEIKAVALAGKSVARGAWEQVEDAAVWRVEVRGGPEQELLDVITLEGSVREVALEDFKPGEYTLRVATIDTEGFESVMGEPAIVEVRELLAEAAQQGPEGERRASGLLYLGERLEVAPGYRCEFGRNALIDRHVDANRAGTFDLSCRDESGQKLPPRRFTVEPNAATLATPELGVLKRGQVEEVRFELEHPLERVEVTYPDGFSAAEPPRQDASGAWIVPVRVDEPERAGMLRIGTPGILGSTLLEVPLQSAAALEQDATLAAAIEEKPWHVHVGAFSGSRDALQRDLNLEGSLLNQGLRFGVRAGTQWRRRLAFDVEFDLGGVTRVLTDNALRPQLDRGQIFGLHGQLAYRFGPWAIKPFLGAGGGINWVPSFSLAAPEVMGGGGVVWVIERRVEVRFDLRQSLVFASEEEEDVRLTTALLGFGGVF